MTPEEKVALLKEARVWDVVGFPTCIDKLFDLVAAAEREACAKVCEELVKGFNEEADNSRLWCAAAIRARSENGTA